MNKSVLVLVIVSLLTILLFLGVSARDWVTVSKGELIGENEIMWTSQIDPNAPPGTYYFDSDMVCFPDDSDMCVQIEGGSITVLPAEGVSPAYPPPIGVDSQTWAVQVPGPED